MAKSPRCPFCKSQDTDYPYFRPSRVWFLSSIVSGLHRRVCRNCGRHFLALKRKNVPKMDSFTDVGTTAGH